MNEIEQLSSTIIEQAIQSQASDIHLIPLKKKYLVQLRIHGRLIKNREINAYYSERLISHLKYQAGMDIGERRKPQSASSSFTYQNKQYSLRLSTLPAHPRESLAIRLSHESSIKNLTQLPLFSKHIPLLRHITKLNQGLCLLTGPTGSGKTTTLYSLIHEMIEKENKMVLSIEDPIEQQIEKAVQIQTNEKAGMTFEKGLKAILRHDPDVIFVGEIREKETAELVLKAALTGHLVLATIHSSDCYSAVLRMKDFGLSPIELAEACQIVLSQRLILPSCPYCSLNETENENCMHFNWRGRKAVYEEISGNQVKRCLFSAEPLKYRKLKEEMKLAFALGFIEQSELERQGW